MGWITLSLRKLSLRAQISDLELQDITLSRQLRGVHRHLSYEKSIFNSDKKNELAEAKAAYDEIRNKRPSVDSDEYKEWSQQYADAKEEYESKKTDINDYYDNIMSQIEEDATDKETDIQEEQTTIEAELEAMRQELQVVSEQISSDIQESKVSLK